MEIYERIEGYEHHEVSNLGNVRRIKTKLVLKLRHLDLMSFYKYGPLMLKKDTMNLSMTITFLKEMNIYPLHLQ